MAKLDASTILDEARERASCAKEAWSEIYQKARDDIQFLSDDPAAQWDEAEYRERKNSGRPTITIDQVSQFVHQVENDIRMNTPAIRAIPHSGDADVDTAKIINGKIKDIEYQSGADEAYDTAASFAVRCSIGYITVDHDYAERKGFNQEFCIKRITNPFGVLIDPASTEIDGSDAEYGFIFDTMSVKEFQRKWPGKEVCSFWDEQGSTKTREQGDEVVVAQYFWIEREEEEENPTASHDGEERSRTVVNKRVMRARLSGKEVLEVGDRFPGEYIPIVPVYGEEAWEDGKRKLHSLIRKAKSPAYMFNLWSSLETEVLMKQPMAPVMAAEGQIEDYAEEWLNPAKAGVMRYSLVDINGAPVPMPQRLSPPMFPVGFAQAKQGSVDNIKSSLGMYNASIGQRSNETSGVAINARKVEGEIATYHFSDNLTKSIAQVGRIIVSGLADIYDTPRTIRIIDEEENPKMVGINGARVNGQEQDYWLNRGEYSVRVTTGPSFTTQRQEAVQYLMEMMSTNPQMAQITGDILFKNMDFPGADAVAGRLKKLIPPNLLDEEEREEEAPDPEKIQLQQALQQAQAALEQMQQQMAALQHQAENKQAELQLKAQSEQADAQNEARKLALEQQRIVQEGQLKAAEIALKERELALREREMFARAVQESGIASNVTESAESPPIYGNEAY